MCPCFKRNLKLGSRSRWRWQRVHECLSVPLTKKAISWLQAELGNTAGSLRASSNNDHSSPNRLRYSLEALYCFSHRFPFFPLALRTTVSVLGNCDWLEQSPCLGMPVQQRCRNGIEWGTKKMKQVKSDGVCTSAEEHDGSFFRSPTVGANVTLGMFYRKSGLIQWAHLVQPTIPTN